MTDIEFIFTNRKADPDKLLAFGFTEVKNYYTYSTDLLDGQFALNIAVRKDGKITADVMDLATNDLYLPAKIADATGAFVGKIKAEYEKWLMTIAQQCFYLDVFKSTDAKKVISYVKHQYHDELEFLWPKFPNTAILRRKDNAKWYAALANLAKSKIGLSGQEKLDVINLRTDPLLIDKLIDGARYFPGYHMNKKHWVTICLNGSLPIKEIYSRIDASYGLAKK